MDLIHNERTKYLAASFDRLSTACLAVGVVTQLPALMAMNVGWSAIIDIASWLVGALALHFAGRIVLGGLRS
ncbi:hypothetical protein [Neorhizobium sp. JUb45]|uniref:hypothetical protein n=1 Tax=unclassified Neorhizobium TaxID=2629175 RepID=UPI00104A28E9|nr:hypothetical protein [Neorhizobium sp. JUb45]